MQITVSTGMEPTVTSVTGRLDLRSAPELRAQVMAALVAGSGSMVIDLEDVEFIDSSGLGVLIGLHKQAEAKGGRLAIVPPTGSARQIFALTRTESFFTLVPNQEAARVPLGS
jgi:anti-sigma B factor antagonist